MLSASLTACAVRPALQVTPPTVQPLPAELMEPVPSDDYSQKVLSWLKKVADALEQQQPR